MSQKTRQLLISPCNLIIEQSIFVYYVSSRFRQSKGLSQYFLINRNHLLDEETEEDFVTDILQDVITNALDTIYTRIVDSRVIPYTVNAARELLLDVIEVNFFISQPIKYCSCKLKLYEDLI